MPETEPEFDVVIVGSGIAGALAAYRLAEARPQLRVLMIEAGGVAPDSLGRYALARSYMASPTKLPDSPFCGDDILAPQPSQAMGKPYYDYAAGVELRTQAIVSRLELDQDGRNVRRVWYRRWSSSGGADAGEQSVSATIVILASNAIETPMILFRSSGAANSSGLVGCYLMDHPIKQSFALAPGPLFPFRGPQTTSDIEGFRDGAFRSEFAAFKVSIKNDGWSTVPASGAPRGGNIPATTAPEEWRPGTLLDFVANRGYFGTKLRDRISDHAVRQITLNSACEQLPVKENCVNESDKAANPDLLKLALKLPRIQYKVDDERHYVRKSFDTIVQLHKHIFQSMGIDNEIVLQGDTGPDLTYGGSGHIMGTTIMGANPKESVVDQDCRSHDLGNLYILGSSVFPTSTRSHLRLPICLSVQSRTCSRRSCASFGSGQTG